MTINSVDTLVAGFTQPPQFFDKGLSGALTTSRWFSSWQWPGIPGPGTYDNTLAGVTLSSSSALVAGQIPFYDPGAGNSYLAKWLASNSQASGVMMLCDRLWHNGNIAITTTGAQTVGSPTWPARDLGGTTNGDGVFVAIEVQTAVGLYQSATSFTYTNSAGVGSRTATMIDTQGSGGAGLINAFYLFGLQAGDTGVKSIQSISLNTSWASGTINMVAFRPIMVLDGQGIGYPSSIDALMGGLPRLYNGTVPFIVFMPLNNGNSTRVSGQMIVAQG